MATPPASPSSHPRRERGFARNRRVLRSAEFERAMRGGVRVGDAHLALWAIPNGLPHARLGLVVGKRCGNAPRRNRAKRILREAFRLLGERLPGGADLICRPHAADISLPHAIESLAQLAARAARKFVPRPAE